MLKGEVVFFSGPKGYGFLSREDGEGDIFCHFSSIDPEAMGGYRTLKQGQKVSFEIGRGPKGIQAEKVKVIE